MEKTIKIPKGEKVDIYSQSPDGSWDYNFTVGYFTDREAIKLVFRKKR